MSDLTDDELDDVLVGGINADSVEKMLRGLRELQRSRAEQAAGREHVERVVREACIDVACEGPKLTTTTLATLSSAIASRVADRMSPVLSEDKLALLVGMRGSQAHSLESIGHLREDLATMLRANVALLDRLIAARKP